MSQIIKTISNSHGGSRFGITGSNIITAGRSSFNTDLLNLLITASGSTSQLIPRYSVFKPADKQIYLDFDGVK